ncbi:hypothetical protein L195_g043246 [Trifolium pratense]|uniref:Uncharacterized protein n=1 Tax=Trifolium pratense TaxID=57577 RepID=A0A2K3M8P9_TRIPR|nr:hypothetical protein L195_g043246 [Trifolium pratense]
MDPNKKQIPYVYMKGTSSSAVSLKSSYKEALNHIVKCVPGESGFAFVEPGVHVEPSFYIEPDLPVAVEPEPDLPVVVGSVEPEPDLPIAVEAESAIGLNHGGGAKLILHILYFTLGLASVLAGFQLGFQVGFKAVFQAPQALEDAQG